MKTLVVTGIVAATLTAAGLGSYGVARALPAEFPLVYAEKLDPAATGHVTIADPATALTFARVDRGDGPRVLAVTAYGKGLISGVDLGGDFTEPIAAFDKLGYEAIRAIATDPGRKRVTVAAADTLTSLDTHSHHVGIGTNYKEHQAEATIEEPFVFPKIAEPTNSHSPLPVGAGLLDYEVELGIVALNDISAATGVPEHLGLVLSNDWTDRELLVSQIEPDNLTGGAGFTNAKSQPGFLSTGDLFVIPADWAAYYTKLQLDLFVNGDLRQRAHPDNLIWDVRTMIAKTLAAGDRTWDSDGVPTLLTDRPGVITRGTILQTGTPEGVVYRAPDTRQRFLGFLEWAGSFGTNADSIVDSALQVYVRDARNAGVYLKPGDEIVTRADGLGQIFTTITN
ncbi:fumarylacetoacetate hydrolase family protein [Actinoplanes bogorensis]|uniref:Fumarylacetoacetate hydrolase family protein n=1 Tax=Paractinoplanes bogorensis TaxID=1610840 RepID=A0ABS5YXS3_9ACTN|nr:fumarylacetoacetate hydrolase family protein [Actinoplanes bogorensis]MBU2668183.1 fumarylacetoacetate hydrolase family protein [Actinoplanes bogorensis]